MTDSEESPTKVQPHTSVSQRALGEWLLRTPVVRAVGLLAIAFSTIVIIYVFAMAMAGGSQDKFSSNHELSQRGVLLAVAGGFMLTGMLGVYLLVHTGRVTRNNAMVERQINDLEAALRESEAVRNTLDLHSIFSVADAKGRILDVNSLFCEISGYTREELLGKDHRVLNSGEHPKEFWVEVWRTLAAGKAWRGEVCNRAKDGSVYWVDSIIAPFRGADGRIERYVSIRSDLTTRKQVEARMTESEIRFRTLVEGADVVVWEFDWDTEAFTYVSPQAYKFGHTNEAWHTKGFWAEQIHPEDRDQTLAYFKAEVEAGGDFRCSYRMIAMDESIFWVEDVVTVEQREDQSPLLRGVKVDITERMESQQALKAAQAKAEDASRAKSAFLANMSHEIRTPLTAILGFADILREDGNITKAPAHRLQTIDTIRNAGVHLLTVINDILDLSKIEADKMTVEKIETSLVGVLREVESLMRPRAEGKGLAMSAKLGTSVPDRVMSDPTRLRQILMNLVGNAVKFTEVGRVTMTARVEEREGRSMLAIDVEDTGPGMTAEQAGRLFTPFGQADNTVTRKYGGTGLGLTICQRLAGLMGGSASLARTGVGEGSCFRVELPLEAAPGAVMISRIDAVQVGSATADAVVKLNGRIVVAEDGADNLRLIMFHLRKAGATVETAENGLIALNLLEKNAAAGSPFDLLLTDMQMPEMDGYTLARTLRQRGNPIAIVALTAHAMAEDRAKCIDAGCDDYASKPIDKAKLLATCAAWLGKGSTQKLAA